MNDQTATYRPVGRKPRVVLRTVLVLAGLGLIGAGLIGFHIFKAGILRQVTAGIAAQLPTVAVTRATMQSWQPLLNATGSLRASSGADLSAQVSGVVSELHFDSGNTVPAGALLVRLLPNDDDAKLAQLQATAALDEVTLHRDRRQLHAQGIAESTVDTDIGTLQAAQAQVAAQAAVVAEKFVRAPFAGRLGLREVDLGQFLSAGTKMVTLQALDPIFLDFYLPQQALGQVRVGQSVSVHIDAYPGRDFSGTLSAADAEADSASRMIQMRATLRNADHALLPGMFATADVAAGDPRNLVTIPLAAITANPYGSLVYVVRQDGEDGHGKPKLVAKQAFVTTGDTRGDQVAVLKGVAAGDDVVTAGQLKLHEGAAVLIDNSVQPSNDAAASPNDQ